MKNMIKLIQAAMLVMMFPVLASSQITKERDVIGVAGGFETATDMQLSWTVGEIAVQYYEAPGLMVMEGFQQGASKAVGIQEVSFPAEIKVFPNPVNDVLKFKIDLKEAMDVGYELYDVQGKLLTQLPPMSIQTGMQGQINMRSYPAGNYILRFYAPSSTRQMSFNIIKTK